MPPENIHLRTLTPSIDNLILSSTQSIVQAHELVSFLGTAQRLNVDLLSIPWQPTLGKVGVGGTSDIFQALVNANTTLAFKCCSENPEQTNTEQIYRKLKAEVLSLSHPSIQKHPNIVNLVGICWDVKQEGTVYPVLVTEKSQRGDLRSFLDTKEGIEMSIQDRLHLCCEVACALDALHAAGIAHGDVKPENVLIFVKSNGSFRAKLTDFGYSVFRQHDSGGLKLARSEPWTHQLYRGEAITFETAVMMEAYSFGVVCLWVILHKHLIETQLRVWMTPSGPIYFAGTEDVRHLLMQLKRSDKLQNIAQQLLETCQGLNQDEKASLTILFNLTLSPDRQLRPRRLDSIARLLPHSLLLMPDFGEHDQSDFIHLPHGTFQLADELYRLYSAEQSVRRNLIQALLQSVEDGCCEKCKTNSAFQVALCYDIGFGIPRDLKKCGNFLDLANRSQKSLEQAKSVARRQTQLYKNELARHFYAGGYLDPGQRDQLPAEVTDVAKLDDIEAQYLREIQDLQASLGDATLLTDRLNLCLLDIKIFKREFENAESVLNHLISRISTHSGEPAWNFILHDYWTHINFLKGDYQAAEVSCRRTADYRLSSFGEGHVSYLNNMIQLMRILQYRSKYDACEEIGVKIIDISERYLGPAHEDTMIILLLVGNSMGYSGNISRAKEILYKAMRGLEKIRGTGHEDTLACYTSLGEVLRQQGKYEDSEIIIKKAIEGYKKKLTENNPETLNAMDILALLRFDQGRHAEAEELCRHIIQRLSEIYDGKHPDTLDSVNNLELILYNLEKYTEAEALCRQVLQSREKSLHGSHQLLITMNNLGLSLYGQDKYDEAEVWFRKALDGFNTLLGSAHVHALFSMHNIALNLHYQEKSEEAEPLISHVWEKRKEICGLGHPETLNSQAVLGMVVHELGNHERAVSILRDAAKISDGTLGLDHPTSLEIISRLGDVLAQGDEGDVSEAAAIYQRMYDTFHKINGDYHKQTLNVRNKHAVMLHKLGKLQESEDLLDISIFRTALGNIHPETEAAIQNLSVVYEDQGRFEEAEKLLSSLVYYETLL